MSNEEEFRTPSMDVPPRPLEEVRPLQELLRQEAQALKQEGEEALVSIRERPGDAVHPWSGEICLVKGSRQGQSFEYAYRATVNRWERSEGG